MPLSDTVLILDDEPNTVELCQRLLRKNYRLIAAQSGAEALALTEKEDVALALVDQRMPAMTGLEFLMRFVKTHPRTSRVVMTAYADLDDIVALINQGKIHAFVLKPWNNHQLRLTVDREIEHYRQSRTIEQLTERLRREHRDMFDLLRELDPDFVIPDDNTALKESKNRLRQRVANEVERLFLEQLLQEPVSNVAEVARSASINRTFLYRLLRRHGMATEIL
jgi:DNA-binding NtrC family response regulator